MNSSDKSKAQNPSLAKRIAKLKEEELNDTTRNFLESLCDYYDSKGYLTENQIQAFEKIESRFSPQEKLKLKAWIKNYKENYLKDTKIVAKYYLQSGYYQTVSRKILNEEDFVPSEAKLKKILGNKYAQQVLKLHYDEPRFEINDLVKIRKSAGSMLIDSHLIELRERSCFVLENNLPVKHSVKGGKRYSILPMGTSTVVECDERNLILPKKKRKKTK